MKIILFLLGFGLIGLSIYGRYWRGKRRFDRRNIAGVQVFKNYNDSLKKQYFENFIHFLGVAAFIVGLIILLFAYFGYDSYRAGMAAHGF